MFHGSTKQGVIGWNYGSIHTRKQVTMFEKTNRRDQKVPYESNRLQIWQTDPKTCNIRVDPQTKVQTAILGL